MCHLEKGREEVGRGQRDLLKKKGCRGVLVVLVSQERVGLSIKTLGRNGHFKEP